MAEIKCYKLTDSGLKLVGVVDDYTSFSLTRKYSDIGEWQLVISALTDNAKLIKDIDFISMGNGVAGIIRKNVIKMGEGNEITYTGMELKGITTQRIVMPPSTESHLSYNNTPPEDVIAGIIETQLINCENAEREIPFMRIADYQKLAGRTINYSGRFSDAYLDVTTIATTYNIGWYADIQPIEGNEQYAEIVFHIYNGIDRSTGQSTNSRLELSYENDSLASTYFEANKGIPTTALVAGQGEGVDRSVELINDAVGGLERNEIYVDARDINDNLLLVQRGQEKLAEYGDNANYQITFNQLMIDRYKNDFDLGDIGTITDSIAGSTNDVRLTEITEIYEQGEYRIDVTFGYDKQSLGDTIRRSTSNAEALIKTEGGTNGGTGDVITTSQDDVGAIFMWGKDTPPTGCLICDGSAVSRGTYSLLFAEIGTTYGTGDGSTTFNLPNLKGRIPVGRDSAQTEFDVLGEVGGEKTHLLTASELPMLDVYIGGSKVGWNKSAGGAESRININTTAASWNNNWTGGYDAVASSGGAQSEIQKLPPYIVLNYVIRYLPSYSNVENLGEVQMPIGGIIEYTSNNVPDSTWLVCDGSAISRTEYADLYTIIGTTYGNGDGTTTFNLPNLKGKVIVGRDSADTSFDVLGETGGAKTVMLAAVNIPELNVPVPFRGTTPTPGYSSYQLTTALEGMTGLKTQGGSSPHENMPPYIVLNYIIKVKANIPIAATVEDNLTSTSTTNALSAKKGKELKDSITALESRTTTLEADSGWINASYESAWGAYPDATYGGVQFRKIGKLVMFRGLAAGGLTGEAYSIIRIPEGYRPSKRLIVTAQRDGGNTRMDITPAGAVAALYTGSNAWVSFAHISYYID